MNPATTTQPLPAQQSTNGAGGAPDWRRIFDSLPVENDYRVDEIEGRLPEGLRGTLYRNGPARNDIGTEAFAHLFDGDGMLSQLTFDGEGLRYRNRFVRTNHFVGSREADRPRYRGFGQQKPGGVLANALRLPENTANTSVTFHAGNLLALWEGGKPWRLDPDTLDTMGEYDFDGELKRGYAFSAHPKGDPATGELFNFGIQYGPRTRIRSYRIDRGGRLHHLEPVTLPYPVMNHDFALTSRHLVFVVDPIIVRIYRMLSGLSSYDGALRWDPSKPTLVILVPRDGGRPRIAECEPFFHFHVNNAFEDGSDTVVDLFRYEDGYGIGDSLRDFRGSSWSNPTRLVRLRIGSSNEVAQEELCPWEGEFPQHDWRLTTRTHRFAYFAGRPAGEGAPFTAIVKVDHASGDCQAHEFGEGQVAGEPIFVPRSADAGEDDGWLLTLVYSAFEHRSRLVVLDARDLQGEPVAVAHLRHHVPLGFHGTFTDRVAEPGPLA